MIRGDSMQASNNNYIFQSMLDWCRNLQATQDDSTELALIAPTPTSYPSSTRNLIPPKFADPNNQRRLNSESRKGIKTHFSRALKVDKQTQTNIQEDPLRMDSATQTISITIHPLGTKKSSLIASRHQSPLSKLEQTNTIKMENCITERTNLMEFSKGTLDYKNELNRETKASYNMLESQQKAFRFDDRSFHNVKNVDSYHLPETAKMKPETLVSIYPQAHPIMRSHLPHRTAQAQQRMVESIRNTISEEESNTFSQKYRNMLRNVESEFKLSQKRNSEKKIKFTPEKRVLFQERQTIVSKYGESYQEEKSMRVEQSLVYDRDIRSFFTIVGQLQPYSTFSMFLAIENTAHLVISIKEISVRYMNNISEELLVYRQMEEKRMSIDGVLQLYQTQIDRDSYLFIKEPYTDTLINYINHVDDIATIEAQARAILTQMECRGFTLKTHPKLEDFIVCYDMLKIQNPGIFQFDQRKKIEIQSALLALKDQILHQLL